MNYVNNIWTIHHKIITNAEPKISFGHVGYRISLTKTTVFGATFSPRYLLDIPPHLGRSRCPIHRCKAQPDFGLRLEIGANNKGYWYVCLYPSKNGIVQYLLCCMLYIIILYIYIYICVCVMYVLNMEAHLRRRYLLTGSWVSTSSRFHVKSSGV